MLFLVLVALVALPVLVGSEQLLVSIPADAIQDEPMAFTATPDAIGATIRITDDAATYRSEIDAETMTFIPRRPGRHEVLVLKDGDVLQEGTFDVAPPSAWVFEPTPEETPVEEPAIEEPSVEPVAAIETARIQRPPLAQWKDDAWSRGAADDAERTRTQARHPGLTVDDVRADGRGRHDIRVRAPGSNALEAHGAVLGNESIAFLPPAGTSTDIVLADLTVENATIQLAKNSRVDAIARCDAFTDGRCARWTTTDIPFTDHGAYVEFTVPHFSGYSGVDNATYYYAENTTAGRANTATKVQLNLTFEDPSGSEWLIVAFSQYVMNTSGTGFQGRVALNRDGAVVAKMDKTSTEVAEANTLYYLTNHTGDGGNVSFYISMNTSHARANVTLLRTRILALRLDGRANANYNVSYNDSLFSNQDATFGNAAADALNVTLEVRDPGTYLVYGGGSYGSDSTTVSSRMRLVMDGAVIDPDTYLEEEDANVSETHIGTMARVVTMGTGTHTFAVQFRSESGALADWQYPSVGVVRLTDAYTYWYANASANTFTVSTTTPANVVTSVNTTYATHNYTIIASGLIAANNTARRTDARIYVNDVIQGNATIRPRDISDYVSGGMVALVSSAASITANMTVITNNAQSNASMKYADLLVIEVGNYTNPIILANASANVSGPVANGTPIKVNASIANITGPITARLLVTPPTYPAHNRTLSQNGNEWYNSSIILNETGLWTFTFFANDSIGFAWNETAIDGSGTPYLEVYLAPNVTGVRLSPTSTFGNDTLTGFCNATAGADRPLTYNLTWFFNDIANRTRTYIWEGIAVGENHVCGLRAKDRRVTCWGYDQYGDLGNGVTGVSVAFPTPTNDSNAYTMVGAGSVHTCGVRASDGVVLCWGRGLQGRLGTGDTANMNTPTAVMDTSAFTMVSAGLDSTCGVRANDSRVLCWGSNNFGQVGNNDPGISSLAPNLTSDTSAYAMVSVGGSFACGVRANDSRVLCWGRNNEGQVGNNDTGTNANVPTLTNDTSAYLMVSANLYHACGVRANDSRVLCWGSNDFGELGNNETGTPRSIPTLTNDTSAYLMVAAGTSHTCGIRANDSRVLCWGYNGAWQLGNTNPGVDTNIPVLVNTTDAYRAVSGGGSDTCGIRANDSRVLCWGFNGNGQLGNDDAGNDQQNPVLTRDTLTYHGGRGEAQEYRAGLLTPPLTPGYNVTLQCSVYDGYSWSSPRNSSTVVVQDTGPPVLSNITAISAVTLQAGQNVTVFLNFTARDPDGVAALNDSLANFSVTNGSVTRRGVCSPVDLNASSARYLCNVSMPHYSIAGPWKVNVSVGDNTSANVSNGTTTFTVNALVAIGVWPSAFSFGTITVGQQGFAASNPLMVDNQGNVNLTGLNVTGYALANGSRFIGVGNVTVNTTLHLGSRLVNGTGLNLTNTSLTIDTDAGEANRSLYFTLTVPNGTPSYVFTAQQAWEVVT